jgi:hypothetical protein
MKILIPFTGQLFGSGIKPEQILRNTDGVFCAEPRGMLYDG